MPPDKIKETKYNGYVENGDIPVYRFEMTTNENKNIGIYIIKKLKIGDKL